MTSLRIALKQSLEESSGLAVSSEDASEKKLRRSSKGSETGGSRNSRQRRTSTTPRKSPSQGGGGDYDDDDEEAEFSSENEFSVDDTQQPGGGSLEHEREEGGDYDLKNNSSSTRYTRQDVTEDKKGDHLSSAASKIQSHWKKKMIPSDEAVEQPPSPRITNHAHLSEAATTTPPSNGRVRDSKDLGPPSRIGRQKSGDDHTGASAKSKTVQAPLSDILHWSRSLPIKRSRRNVAKGMRVKVRFATKIKRDGKLIRKKKWFGGRVVAVSKEGSKIRIKYDDGTSEITKFPDKDVVIDDNMNGVHECPVKVFLPPETSDGGSQQNTTNTAALSDINSNLDPKTGSVPSQETVNVVSRESSGESSASQFHSEADNQSHDDFNGNNSNASLFVSGEISTPLVSTQESQISKNEDLPLVSTEKLKKKRGRPHKVARYMESDETFSTVDAAINDETIVTSEATNKGATQFSPPESNTDVSDYGHKNASVKEQALTSEKPLGKLTIRIPNIMKDERNESNLRKIDTQQSESSADTSTTEEETVKKGQMAQPIRPKKRNLEGTGMMEQSSAKRLHIHIQSPRPSFDSQKKSEFGDSNSEAVANRLISSSPLHMTETNETASSGQSLQPSTITSPKPRKIKKHVKASMSADITADAVAIKGKSSRQQNDIPVDYNAAQGKQREKAQQEGQDNAQQAGKPAVTPRTKKSDNVVRRRAPLQANERVSTKPENTDATTPVEETLLRRKRKKERRIVEEGNEKGLLEEDSQWVQCDSCGKWRIIPSAMVATLPKQWYCADNIWDQKRASCDAPEQSAKQVAKALAKEKKRRKRQEMMMKQNTGEESLITPTPTETLRESSVKIRSVVRHDDQNMSIVDTPLSSDEISDPLGRVGKSTVSLATKTKTINPIAGLDIVTEESNVEPVKKGRGRPRRTDHILKDSDFHRESSSQANADEGDNLEWVQCEKCDKWRKLPPHISADELPDIWYCSMNTWNFASASCDAPEDKADGLQDIGVFGTSGGLGSSKLSYRNLIFGSTGRKTNRPISERTRASESIFAVPNDDPDAPPAVMYANSSVFQTRKSQNPDDNDDYSVLDLMSRSNLWDELKTLANVMNNRDPDTFGSTCGRPAYYTLDMLPDEMQESVKDIVLQLLGTETLGGDEILQEIQKMDWEHVPQGWTAVKQFCCRNVIITALCSLYKEGVVDCIQEISAEGSTAEWNPKYRRAKPSSAIQQENDDSSATMPSKCCKFKKPKKHAIVM